MINELFAVFIGLVILLVVWLGLCILSELAASLFDPIHARWSVKSLIRPDNKFYITELFPHLESEDPTIKIRTFFIASLTPNSSITSIAEEIEKCPKVGDSHPNAPEYKANKVVQRGIELYAVVTVYYSVPQV